MSLKILNLSYIYQDKVILYSDVTFKVGITVISAPSGAGKTTLFLLFLRLLSPSSGFIYWNEKNIQDYNKLDYLSLVPSIVFQGGQLSDYFTLAQYIELLLLSIDSGTREQANFYIKYFQMDYLLNKNISTCSGGEKYKISLFLALLKNTPLLLLDEPTAHLDSSNSLLLLSLLKNIKNKIILIITHDKILFDHLTDCYFYSL